MNPPDEKTDQEVTLRARRLMQGRNAPRAGRSLGELGQAAVGALTTALGHENPFVRSGALIGLETAAGAGANVGAVVLRALEHDADGRVQETACAVLGRLGLVREEKIRAALERARDSADPRVAKSAVAALRPR